MTEQTPEKTFDVLLRVLRGIEKLRIQDTPLNDLAFIYKEGHEEALDNAMNIIRKEL